jgi:ubiquinone/menaquinone biosynthesis C-methylase UbiE
VPDSRAPLDAARYDGRADWYDVQLADTELGEAARRIVYRLLGAGPGRVLDVGCGTGLLSVGLAARGWSPIGIDNSEDQLRRARARDTEVLLARAEALPFEDESFDAAVSMWTHTDVDANPELLAEAHRVLLDGSPFVYLGVHPCFIGPHSRFVAAQGVPTLFNGDRSTESYTDGPGISPQGLRAKVGATHLPLGQFLQAFLDAGFRLERFEEPASCGRAYPYMVALRCRR